MTQKEYLDQLTSYLELLDEDIVENIVESYNEKISISITYEEKNMDDILAELGTPEELANKIYRAYKVKKGSWSPSKNLKSTKKKKFRALLIDILICSWLIPIMFMILLAGIGSFGSLPVTISACFNYDFFEGLTMIILIFGSYIILFVLIVLFIELFLVVLRNFISMNIKAFTPQYQTAARLVKNLSLFKQLEKIKVGKNTFINMAMISLSVIGIIFLFINTYKPEMFESFGQAPVINDSTKYEVDSLIDVDKTYDLVIQVGEMRTTVVRTKDDTINVNHTYNMEDNFNISVRENSSTNIMYITADKNVSSGIVGLFNAYEASTLIEVPESIQVNSLTIESDGESIIVNNFSMNDLNISTGTSEVVIDGVTCRQVNIDSDDSDIIIKNSFADSLDIENGNGYIYLSNINNLLKVGENFNVLNTQGNIVLDNIYFSDIAVYSNTSNINYSYDNVLFNAYNVLFITNGDVTSDRDVVVQPYELEN